VGSGVLIVEDDEDLLPLLAEMLGLSGFGVVPVHGFGELLDHQTDALGCGVALLDINLGPDQPSGLDVYRWLRDNGFRGRICFLTGHARSHPLVARARELDGALVLEKPVYAAELVRLIDRADLQ
jgi:FixJ family two-component response regulator